MSKHTGTCGPAWPGCWPSNSLVFTDRACPHLLPLPACLPFFCTTPLPCSPLLGLPSPPYLPPKLPCLFWTQDPEWPPWLLSGILDQMPTLSTQTSAVSDTHLRKGIWPRVLYGACIWGQSDVDPASNVYLSRCYFRRPGMMATPMMSFPPCRHSKRNTTEPLFPYEEVGTEKD